MATYIYNYLDARNDYNEYDITAMLNDYFCEQTNENVGMFGRIILSTIISNRAY